ALTQKVSQTNNQINVQKLSSGVYIIKVLADGKIGTQKFVKK
ncbi:MAG: T9SS type A sorting domain-containing protein, partial [Polaribacter sp.]|nr:T9SS type A sorting domain-containing protein [Polaribacter sp.]